ncbi:MAG: hypothetical protein A2277_10000 [Desulfobacterales bacterium RIFOXYA12_FULL_46_15]|nr:MAG: hypothetical protein A2277_10000 [Desulfobacterales bacterium RIFOXYA12_FULL_46_15]
MKERIQEMLKEVEADMISFARELTRIKSYTGQEKDIVMHIRKKMLALGYDDVIVDGMGNVIGIIGNGPTRILYDSHVDTVAVRDEQEWTVKPFGGELIDGNLYGRGAVDMKSAVAASVYAGYAMKKLKFHEGKTIYISTSVMEEDFDGESIFYECTEGGLNPDFTVICEPTQCKLAVGQRGRALIRIKMSGIPAHGGAPEKGDNPVYKTPEIIRRIEALGNKFMAMEGEKGSLALTCIEVEAASKNAIPSKCSIYVDRRLVKGEDETAMEKEMNALLAGTDAAWEVYKVTQKSWTGRDITLHSFMPAWEIDKEHLLTKAAIKAFSELNGAAPELCKWDFSTNGVASMTRLGIPTIGFGPGDPKQAHCVDEHCPVEEIKKAFEFYIGLAARVSAP